MKAASRHWIVQRLTAIALIPLAIWFLVSLWLLPDLHYATARAWIALPLNALLLGMMIVVLCWHSLLGVQVVVEDYVHHRGAHTATLLLSTSLHILSAAAALFSIVKIAGVS